MSDPDRPGGPGRRATWRPPGRDAEPPASKKGPPSGAPPAGLRPSAPPPGLRPSERPAATGRGLRPSTPEPEPQVPQAAVGGRGMARASEALPERATAPVARVDGEESPFSGFPVPKGYSTPIDQGQGMFSFVVASVMIPLIFAVIGTSLLFYRASERLELVAMLRKAEAERLAAVTVEPDEITPVPDVDFVEPVRHVGAGPGGEEPEVDDTPKVGPVEIWLQGDALADSLTVTCDGGFSGRARFRNGFARIDAVPITRCRMSISGPHPGQDFVTGGSRKNCTLGQSIHCTPR